MKFGFIAMHRGIWPAAWLCGARFWRGGANHRTAGDVEISAAGGSGAELRDRRAGCLVHRTAHADENLTRRRDPPARSSKPPVSRRLRARTRPNRSKLVLARFAPGEAALQNSLLAPFLFHVSLGACRWSASLPFIQELEAGDPVGPWGSVRRRLPARLVGSFSARFPVGRGAEAVGRRSCMVLSAEARKAEHFNLDHTRLT